MTEYFIATGENTKQLSGIVNVLLQSGWECQGGICRTETPDSIQSTPVILLQAMIRENREPKTDKPQN